MHFNKTKCNICGLEISNSEERIKRHIMCHETEWLESLREKYKV